MGSNDPKISQIQTNFQTLSTVASSLNVASDELTKVVRKLDEALKKLNVGLTVWIVFEDRSDEQYADQYDCDQIGYCKVNGKWGISLRRIWGHEFYDATRNEEGPWLFTDAPREMRLRSVDKIPVLIEALSKEASNTTKKIQEKTKEVGELASVIEKITHQPNRKYRTVSKNADKVVTVGFSSEQLAAILATVQQQQKFLGELLAQASRWELGSDDLWIYFPADKRQFAELLEGRESLSKVNGVANHVLGYPVRVVVKTEPRAITNSAASTGKGSK